MTVCSDHGMVPLTETVDIQSVLNSYQPLKEAEYSVILYSTMARFYPKSIEAEQKIRTALAEANGHFVTEQELVEHQCDFNGKYGSLIFLVNEGVQISPSHMGRVPCNGMHGYDPAIPDMKACFMSSYTPEKIPRGIWDMYTVYREMD